MSAVLELDRVTYWYPGTASPALVDASLTVGAGEFVVVAGLTGSGKSTLLRAACGLVPHFHGGELAGRVCVAGMDTREHGPGHLAARVGTLLQDPETQVVMSTVRAELAFPLENRGEGDAAVARGVEEVALALGIANLLERPVHELSGGELQRVALGAALAGRPDLVLLDEPTSQLDPVAGDELIWLLRRLNEEWGTTVLLSEHRLERCLAAADRVVATVDGRIACDAPPAEFLAWAGRAAPALETPGARLFARAGLRPLPAGVKEARATLRGHGLLPDPPVPPERPRPSRPPTDALRVERLWYEVAGGRSVLRDVSLAVGAGEVVALMGRNGAGKTTLLRAAAGLIAPSRGRVRAPGRVAMLVQNPGDLLLAERAGDEADADELERVGLAGLADRHPRDLSGGQRQLLALAAILSGGAPPAVLALDEPTRGMDRAHKGELADRLRRVAADGVGVVVATHDPELAARLADRVVLLGDGRPVADGAPEEVLAGGWYFATETARILGGHRGVLEPEPAAELVRRRMTVEAAP